MMGCELLGMWPREAGPAECERCSFGNMAEDDEGARLAILRLLLSISQMPMNESNFNRLKCLNE